MSLTKEDVRRAAAIMESILTEWDGTTDQEERDSMVAVRGMLDIMKSPLFSALVDIRDQCKKSVQDSEQWNETAEVRVTDKPEVVAQFKQKYNIAGSHENGLGTGTASTPPHPSPLRDMDHLIDDISAPSSHTPQSQMTSSHAFSESSRFPLQAGSLPDRFGSALNEEHHRNPSVSSAESFGSTGERGKKGKRKGSGEGVTLGHLAHTQTSQAGIPLRTLRPQEVGVVRHQNSESSLSSLASETGPPPVPPSPPPPLSPPPPPPPASLPDSDPETADPSPSSPPVSMVEKNEQDEDDVSGGGDGGVSARGDGVRCASGTSVKAGGEAGVRGGPKDILFFMRDQKSMTDVRTALNGKWGRDPREVTIPCVPDPDQIGMELCGLANTGVFIAEIREMGVAEGAVADRLQAGDQILKLNGQSTENMAWFEVSYLMKGGEQGEDDVQEEGGGRKEETCTLMVQYNPAGFADFQRSQKKQSN